MKLITWLTNLNLISTSTANIIVSGKEDPCKAISGKNLFSYDEAVDCLNNFSLDPNIKKEHIDNIKKYIDLYVSIDSIKKAPDSRLASNIDVLKELKKVENNQHKLEVNLHKDLFNLFKSVNDCHFTYESGCINKFYFNQPFPLIAFKGEQGNTIVKVFPNNNFTLEHRAYWKQHGIDINKYLNKEIVLIDGQLPLDYLQSYSDKYIGISRDPNSRLALSLTRPIYFNGAWTYTFGFRINTQVIPKEKAVTYTFNMGNKEEKISVPYAVSSLYPFRDSQSYYNSYCKQDSTLYKVITESKIQEKDNIKGDSSIVNNIILDELNNPLTNGLNVISYIIKENIGVLVIQSFDPKDEDKFVLEVSEALKTFQQKQVKKIIIDVSNNAGGIVCLGYNLVEYFFPNAKQKQFYMDQRSTPFNKHLVRASTNSKNSHDPTTWLKSDTTYFNDTEDFLKERHVTYNGMKGIYTQLMKDNCLNNPFSELIKSNKYQAPYQPKDIIILTNGVCYSTCSIFASAMELFSGVNTVLVGVNNNKPATISSCSGGEVYFSSLLLEDIEKLNVSHPGAPKRPKLPSTISYLTKELILEPANSKNPKLLEFTWIPSKKQLTYSEDTLLNPISLWKKVAEMF